MHVDGVIEAPMGEYVAQRPPDSATRRSVPAGEHQLDGERSEAWAQFAADWLELESHEAYCAKLEDPRRARERCP